MRRCADGEWRCFECSAFFVANADSNHRAGVAYESGRASGQAEIRELYESACSTIAQMHAAAVGEFGRGPKRGVVEDVADVRKERDELRREVLNGHTLTTLKRIERERDDLRSRLSKLESIEERVQAVAYGTFAEWRDGKLRSPPRSFSLRELQTQLPWTIHYHRDFRASPMAHKDFGHAVIHVMKAAGKLASVVNDAEHGGSEFKPEEVDPYVADLVVCALRMATTCPGRQLDLEQLVVDRIEKKNGIELKDPAGS